MSVRVNAWAVVVPFLLSLRYLAMWPNLQWMAVAQKTGPKQCSAKQRRTRQNFVSPILILFSRWKFFTVWISLIPSLLVVLPSALPTASWKARNYSHLLVPPLPKNISSKAMSTLEYAPTINIPSQISSGFRSISSFLAFNEPTPTHQIFNESEHYIEA